MKKNRFIMTAILNVIVLMFFFSSVIIAEGAQKGPKPSVTKVSPKKGQQGATLDIIIRGKNFVSSATPNYNDNVKPIFDANCTISGCHDKGKLDFSTYKKVFAKRNKIKEEVDEGEMPPSGPLNQSDVDIIDAWVAAGAPESGGGELSLFMGAGIDVNDVIFESSKKLTANISIAPDAQKGPRVVQVTNPDGQTSQKKKIFSVIASTTTTTTPTTTTTSTTTVTETSTTTTSSTTTTESSTTTETTTTTSTSS